MLVRRSRKAERFSRTGLRTMKTGRRAVFVAPALAGLLFACAGQTASPPTTGADLSKTTTASDLPSAVDSREEEGREANPEPPPHDSESTAVSSAAGEPSAGGSSAGSGDVASSASVGSPSGTDLTDGAQIPPTTVPQAKTPEAVQRLWAVVLAGASEPGDPLLEATVADLDRDGHKTSPTNCDRGAAETLGMNPIGTYTVSVYAESQADAFGLRDQLVSIGLFGEVTEVFVECPG